MPLHLFVVFAAWLLHTEPFFKPRTAILCLVFVFNINTSDLLYFDIMLLKTPDLCNLRTFVAIFFLSRFTHIFRQFLEAKKQTPPIYPLLECMQEGRWLCDTWDVIDVDNLRPKETLISLYHICLYYILYYLLIN